MLLVGPQWNRSEAMVCEGNSPEKQFGNKKPDGGKLQMFVGESKRSEVYLEFAQL